MGCFCSLFTKDNLSRQFHYRYTSSKLQTLRVRFLIPLLIPRNDNKPVSATSIHLTHLNRFRENYPRRSILFHLAIDRNITLNSFSSSQNWFILLTSKYHLEIFTINFIPILPPQNYPYCSINYRCFCSLVPLINERSQTVLHQIILFKLSLSR